MAHETKDVFEFGPYRLNCAEALLTRQGGAVALPPKVFDLLVLLVSNAGRLMEKEELLKALWPDSFVEEANLTVNVAALRKALGNQPDGQSWIETVPKRGYRFAGVVTRPPVSPDPPSIPAEPVAPASVPTPGRRGKYLIAAGVLVLLAAAPFAWQRIAGSKKQVRRPQSIAVLPFQDLSAEDLHAGLGMTDALITKLGTIPELRVRSMSTVRRYDGTDPVEAGKALGADTVVTGSVQRLDKRIRVSVRLLRVQDGQSLWADKFDEFFTNLFAVQDTISEKLANVLALRLTSEELDQLMRRYTENTEAYRLYELGRYERAANPRKALDYYLAAVNEDSRYALPWVEIAGIYVGAAGNGSETFQKNAPLAKQAVGAALRIAPDLAEAHDAAADYKRGIERDYKGARQEIETAVRLNPQSPKSHHSRAMLLAIQGDLQSALNEARLAVSLDPFDFEYGDDLVWILYCMRQYENGLAQLEELRQRLPAPPVDWARFYCYLKLRRVPDAISLMEAALKAGLSPSPAKVSLAHAYALAGRKSDAQNMLDAVPKDWGFYQKAVAELTLGERESALHHLEQSLDEHSVWVEWMKVDPDLDAVRDDPRYQKLLARLGLQ